MTVWVCNQCGGECRKELPKGERPETTYCRQSQTEDGNFHNQKWVKAR